MASGTPLDRLARSVKGRGQSAWAQRPPSISLHQGTVDRVDTFNGIVDFLANDPSGLVIPSVRYMRPYTATNTPALGDVVWGLHFGTDMFVMGQHIVPTNIVIP
jgi:hypothetical protein